MVYQPIEIIYEMLKKREEFLFSLKKWLNNCILHRK